LCGNAPAALPDDLPRSAWRQTQGQQDVKKGKSMIYRPRGPEAAFPKFGGREGIITDGGLPRKTTSPVPQDQQQVSITAARRQMVSAVGIEPSTY
jgi:hypothetical protein